MHGISGDLPIRALMSKILRHRFQIYTENNGPLFPVWLENKNGFFNAPDFAKRDFVQLPLENEKTFVFL